MATVVVSFSGVSERSSVPALASVISASVCSGVISETAVTRVVLPTPKPPATTIFVATGARLRSVCQAWSDSSSSRSGATPGEAASETAESTQYPFQQRAVRLSGAVTGSVHTDLSLVREVAQQHPDHPERHPEQGRDLGHRPHAAAQFDDGPHLGHHSGGQ